MSNRILLTVTLALATTAATAEDRSFDRSLSVNSTPSITISTGSGTIRLHPGSDNQIHIIGHVHGNHGWMSSNGDIDARVQQIVNNPPINQRGNDVAIGEHRSNDLYRNISVDYDINLPGASTISASSGSGDVEIQDVGASLKADTASGSVRARGIHGPANIQTGSGDIELQQTISADVRAQTGSGSIRINGMNGGLHAGTGSGDIEINGQPSQDWKLETGSGTVHLNVGSSSKFNVNAETGSGSIHIEQPFTMQGDINRHHVNAAVNGGGPIIKAETGSGDIQIR
jgi:hypothetical protein